MPVASHWALLLAMDKKAHGNDITPTRAAVVHRRRTTASTQRTVAVETLQMMSASFFFLIFFRFFFHVSYPLHHEPSEDPNPFAAYVVVADDGRMILDDDHIYYNREHYFAAEDVITVVRAFVLAKWHFSLFFQPPDHQVCRWTVPDNSTMAQLWLTNDTQLTDVYFLCRENLEICCGNRCCWDAEHASNKQAEMAGKIVM